MHDHENRVSQDGLRYIRRIERERRGQWGRWLFAALVMALTMLSGRAAGDGRTLNQPGPTRCRFGREAARRPR